ncbi:MAG: GGDEF domain-containing protein [Acetanaerobacterium sp.]
MIWHPAKVGTPSEIFGELSIKKLYGLIVLLCTVLHTVYLTVFFLAGPGIMIVLEAVSVVAYLMLFFAVRRRAFTVILAVLHAGVIVHFVVISLVIGWGCGVEYVLLCMFILEGHVMYRSHMTPHLLRGIEFMLLAVVKALTVAYPAFYINVLATWQQQLLFYVNLGVLCSGAVVCSVLSARGNSVSVRVLEKKASYLQRLAETDPLTNLLNRRSMLARLDTVLMRSHKTENPFCVVMCDIDDFKVINDTYGHASGDFVLKMLADTITEYCGDSEMVCRWGGEEILLLLENTTLAQAQEIINGLRRAVETTPFVYCGRMLGITMTMGITQYRKGASVLELVQEADMLMYAGKKNGKNCVVPDRRR